MAANSPLLRPQPRVSCVGKRGDRPADARVEALNLKELCPCGGRVNRRGALRAAVQGVLAGFLRVAPTSHARQCTAPPRLMPAPRAPAASRGKGKCWPSRPRLTCAHAHRGGRPGGAGGISRPFFGAGCLALVPTEDLFRDSDHIFKDECIAIASVSHCRSLGSHPSTTITICLLWADRNSFPWFEDPE